MRRRAGCGELTEHSESECRVCHYLDPGWAEILARSIEVRRENPESGKRFAVAYLKGHRDYITAIEKGPNRRGVIDIAIKYTALKGPALYEKMVWAEIPPDGYVGKEGDKKVQEWFIENGYQQARADIDKLVDNSYLDFANQVLGRPKT